MLLLLGRLHYYRETGASNSRITLCFLLEVCCKIIAAALVFLVAVIAGGMQTQGPLVLAAGALIIILTAMTHPRLLQWMVDQFCRLRGRPSVCVDVKWREISFWVFLFSVNWLLLGVGFYFLIASLIEIPFSLMPYLTGSFALAGVIGLLVIFAPSGIGVREGVMTASLARALPLGVAAGAAILARVWITIAEVACAVVALLILRLGKKASYIGTA